MGLVNFNLTKISWK